LGGGEAAAQRNTFFSSSPHEVGRHRYPSGPWNSWNPYGP